MKNVKRLASVSLALMMAMSTVACGSTPNGSSVSQTQQGASASQAEASVAETSAAPETPADTSVNYKGKVNYVDIAEQLRADTTLDLAGLTSEKFAITGYAQGYNFDDAWFGSIGQMVNSGCEVVLASGSAQFAFNFGGLPRTAAETEVRVGGVDSLTKEFADLLEGGVYTFCSGSYPSMIGPTIALILRSLEGNELTDANGNGVTCTMSHLVVKNADEIREVMTEDAAGNYAYNAAVISALMDADEPTFLSLVSNADWAQVKNVKATYGTGDKKELAKEYKIGVLRNDVTSDEALAYEAYLKELAGEMGFSITFSESTEGNATKEVNQIETWAAAGFDAMISMSSGSNYDQAATCSQNGMLYVQFASQIEEEDLEDINALESYLGSVGPGRFNEGEVGYRMGKYYIDQGYTKFAIFGGSIMFGAETHAYRVAGMIAAMIENETGVPNGVFTE